VTGVVGAQRGRLSTPIEGRARGAQLRDDLQGR